MSTAELNRGQIVSVAASGIYSGKPRPAVVVQADLWLDAHPSVTLCPITSTLVQAPLIRVPVEPSRGNGLRKSSQLMADKLFSVPAAAIVSMVGRLEASAMAELDLALRG
ncbi:MAG: type II toxin-antitoxin system PemK/MazF family toxin [Synechococcaceae bacterium WB9_4xB_025]|nr:type II toxin-antitoxin system PemK/MazF family toxin [Synechococcaceae bacterium WB9_4xB_025]